VGFSAFPVIMMASYPARLSSAPKVPCAMASPIAKVSGDFATKACPFPPVGNMVPEIGPSAKTSGFSGVSGSRFGLELSSHRRMPRPIPPMYFLAYSVVSFSVWVFPVVKSTWRMRPA